MNESFIVEGLNGRKSLEGIIRINGAKNAALKAMAASVLFDAPVLLENIPDTEDIHVMSAILERIGAKVKWADNSLTIDPSTIHSTLIDPKLAGTMRASVVLTGPLLARFGEVSFPSPGGCVIGARPIDQFIRGYEKMGAVISEEDCNYTIQRSGNEDQRSEIRINFEKKTVGGTETLMMAAVLGPGTVTLTNCAMEPEIVNVAEWLNECGADISGVGSETIVIIGTNGKLLSPKEPYIAIPDRIEAGSYLILGALCAKDLTIENCRPDHLTLLIEMLRESGVPIEIDPSPSGKNGTATDSPNSPKQGSNLNGRISIKGNTQPNTSFKSFDVTTKEYPGFATDFQPQIVTYLTQVNGSSNVLENIYEGRFKYVNDLQMMGAELDLISPNEVSITGPTALHELVDGQHLNAHDIRAGFAIVMAALVAKGTFTVNNAYFIDRGYEKLEERLTVLGASIRRIVHHP